MSEAEVSKYQFLSTSLDETDTGEEIAATEMTLSESASATDWFAVVKNLKQRNRQLLKQMSELEQALAESQQMLQSQQVRSQAQETLILQHTEALNSSQDQVNRLFRELESSHQVAQRQQNLIENLTNRLQTSQERIAQLEQDYNLVQHRASEQSQQLFQSENLCRELQTRLVRQQRQTLQFKAALEQCLALPVPNYQAKAQSTTLLSQQHAKRVLASQSLKTGQPIQPWSAAPEILEDTAQVEKIELREDVDLSVESQPEIQTPLAAESTTLTPSTTELDEEDELLEELDLSWAFDLLKQLDDEEASPEEVSEVETVSSPPPPQLEVLPTTSPEDAIEPSEEFSAAPSNSPSPLLHPLRPLKKLKSLAAIELPSFPMKKTE